MEDTRSLVMAYINRRSIQSALSTHEVKLHAPDPEAILNHSP